MHTYWNAAQASAFAELLLGKTLQYGVLFYDTELRITGWNAGAHQITGWTASEVLGQSTAMLFVEEDRERRLHEHEANTVRVVGVGEDKRWQSEEGWLLLLVQRRQPCCCLHRWAAGRLREDFPGRDASAHAYEIPGKCPTGVRQP